MTDEIRPPPLPKQPYLTAREEPTEPGIGINPEIMTLRRENMRLRRERNAAKEELARSLTSSAPGTGSIPPDLTRKQRSVKLATALGKYGTLLPVVVLLARAAQKRWPDFADVIDGVLQALAP